MARTEIDASNIQAMVQDAWSDLFSQELRENLMLPGLVNKDYEGEITSNGGDTVKVSQINAPTGQNLTVGVDADSFNSEALSSTTIDVKADKRAVGSYDFEDLVMLQSQLGQKESQIREGLLFAVMKNMNDYLYSLVSPSTASPDHEIGLVTDFNASQIKDLRKLAGQSKWNKLKPWWILADPSYYSDILGDTTLVSSDFVGDNPVMSGEVAMRRYSFNIMEDDSRGNDYALAFHPDFLHLVQQTSVQFKVSDKHVLGQFGFKISADVVYGAKLGIDGDKKHIRVQAV